MWHVYCRQQIADGEVVLYCRCDGSKPSTSSQVDRVRLAYAELLHAHAVGEFYVPVQLESKATHQVARWQELCDTTRKESLSESLPWSAPPSRSSL